MQSFLLPVRPVIPHKIALVACGSQKTEVPGIVELLYMGDLFTKSRRYTIANSDRWFILSAKHGLVSPDEPLEPYDRAAAFPAPG